MKELIDIGDVVLRAILSVLLLPFGAINLIRSFMNENIVGSIAFAILMIIGVEFIKSTIKDIKNLSKNNK